MEQPAAHHFMLRSIRDGGKSQQGIYS